MKKDNKEFEESITLKPEEYEKFIQFKKMEAVEAKRKELRSKQTRIQTTRKKINQLLESEQELKKEISRMLKE